ncbi:MAG TPA: hypothetical protein VFM10_01800 [Terriglobales bacterium]|nr:hypothetical protein [Terriglobales bacterium]
MRKLTEVEDAKALMTEAAAWSVMKWLREKKRVRKTADIANEALWAMQKEVKAGWSDELRAAYAELAGDSKNSGLDQTSSKKTKTAIDPALKVFAGQVKEADDEAYRAHMDAEHTFDKAEKILSTSLARDGCKKAINSWDLYEKAIVKAEAGLRSRNAVK